MIVLGEFYRSTSGRDYRVERIRCPDHGERVECRMVMDPASETTTDPVVAGVLTLRCDQCDAVAVVTMRPADASERLALSYTYRERDARKPHRPTHTSPEATGS